MDIPLINSLDNKNNNCNGKYFALFSSNFNHKVCPSLYRVEDAASSKAHELLLAAAQSNKPSERNRMIQVDKIFITAVIYLFIFCRIKYRSTFSRNYFRFLRFY